MLYLFLIDHANIYPSVRFPFPGDGNQVERDAFELKMPYIIFLQPLHWAEYTSLLAINISIYGKWLNASKINVPFLHKLTIKNKSEDLTACHCRRHLPYLEMP